MCREAGDKRGEANALWWLGRADLRGADIASARDRLGEALKSFRAFEMWEGLLGCLEDHAVLARAEGRIDLTVQLASAAACSRDRMRLVRSPRTEKRWQTQLDAVRKAVAADSFDSAWREGRNWQVDEAIARARSARDAAVAVA